MNLNINLMRNIVPKVQSVSLRIFVLRITFFFLVFSVCSAFVPIVLWMRYNEKICICSFVIGNSLSLCARDFLIFRNAPAWFSRLTPDHKTPNEQFSWIGFSHGETFFFSTFHLHIIPMQRNTIESAEGRSKWASERVKNKKIRTRKTKEVSWIKR